MRECQNGELILDVFFLFLLLYLFVTIYYNFTYFALSKTLEKSIN